MEMVQDKLKMLNLLFLTVEPFEFVVTNFSLAQPPKHSSTSFMKLKYICMYICLKRESTKMFFLPLTFTLALTSFFFYFTPGFLLFRNGMEKLRIGRGISSDPQSENYSPR